MHGTPQNTHVRAGKTWPRGTWRPRRASRWSEPSRSSFLRVGDSFTLGQTMIPVFVPAPMFCAAEFFQSRHCFGRSRIEVKTDASSCPDAAPISEQEDIAKQIGGY